MAKTTHRLNALRVQKLTTKGLYADGDGLYLRVTESGSKSCIFRFKRDGALRDMGLGPLSSLNLARARELAAEARQQVRAEARLADARAMTFKECAQIHFASHERSWRSPRHRTQWAHSLATFVYPVIGDLPVGSIDTDLVLKVLEPIWNEKPVTANRVRGRIEAVLDWAKARGARDGLNPATWRGHLNHLLPPHQEIHVVQHHPALAYKELPVLMVELRASSMVGARPLEFLILTAGRLRETLGARFDEIDLEARDWTGRPSA